MPIASRRSTSSRPSTLSYAGGADDPGFSQPCGTIPSKFLPFTSPASSVIDDELKTTRNKLRTRVAVAREGKTELQTLIDRTRDLPPPGLDLLMNNVWSDGGSSWRN